MGNEYFEGDLQSMIDTFDEIAKIFMSSHIYTIDTSGDICPPTREIYKI